MKTNLNGTKINTYGLVDYWGWEQERDLKSKFILLHNHTAFGMVIIIQLS